MIVEQAEGLAFDPPGIETALGIAIWGMRAISQQGDFVMQKLTVLVCACAVALAAGTAIARPKDNVSPARHPNIAAAQRLSTQAFEKVVAAQKANEFDLGGHAQKAKDLLEQANRELKAAAETSNANGH